MKIRIESDEAYPVYFEVPEASTYGVTLDLPDDEVARFRAASAEWDAVQELIANRLTGRNAITANGAVISNRDTP